MLIVATSKSTFTWVGEQEGEKEAGIKHETIEMLSKTR